MTFKNPVHRGGPSRGRFDQLAEYASNFTSSPAFFLFCLLLVGFFVAAHAAHLDIELLLLAGESMTAVTLLLLALLKNAEVRAEHAIQRKLDAIAGALLEAHKDERGRAFEDLRNAIRMEEET
jgi:low affinity Fe/Cu permease